MRQQESKYYLLGLLWEVNEVMHASWLAKFLVKDYYTYRKRQADL